MSAGAISSDGRLAWSGLREAGRRTVRVGSGVLLVAAVLACGSFHLADPDLWGHVLYGSAILHTGLVPRVDPFSYTATGAPWVDHEWLAEVVLAGVWGRWGAGGLIVLELLVCAGVVAAILDATRTATRAGEGSSDACWVGAGAVPLRSILDPGVHPLVLAVLVPLFLSALAYSFQLRPQLFTMLLLAIECALLARAGERLERRARGAAGATGEASAASAERTVLPPPEVLALVPLLALWANLHGGFVAGLGALGVFLAFQLGRMARAATASTRGAARHAGTNAPTSAAPDAPTDAATDGPTDAAMNAAPGAAPGTTRAALAGMVGLVLVGLGALAATLANPYGTDLPRYLLTTLDRHALVSEWRRLDPLLVKHLAFQLVVVATLASVVGLERAGSADRTARSLLGWRLLLAVLAGALAYRHIRHKALFVIVAAPIVLHGVERARRALLVAEPRLRPAPAVSVVVGLLLAASGGWWISRTVAELREDRLEVVFDRGDYPVNAVEFLRVHGIGGNLLAPLEWGQYAIWHLAPAARVFFDGRRETVYPAAVERDYFAFSFGAPGWARAIDDYPTDVVLVQRFRGIHPRLLERSDLVPVYADPTALVFVKRSPATAATLARLEATPDRLGFPWPDLEFP